ncbi:MAG: tail fiber domain-containing protein [Patescibacteria group bacterium]|nr:tail fiber domain-containing protein [Patescibacteria group bacterium]
MINFFKKSGRVLIVFLVFVFAFSLTCPAWAANRGVISNAALDTLNGKENLYYGASPYSSIDSTANLLKLETYSGAGPVYNYATKFRVDKDGNVIAAGNVGIGTVSPGGKLQVSNSASQYLIYGGTGNLSAYGAESNGAGVETRLGSAYNRAGVWVGGSDMSLLSSGNISLGAGGNTTQVYVNTSGNVGIGTTNPGAKLDVRGNNIIAVYGNSSTYGIFGNGAYTAVYGEGGTYGVQATGVWGGLFYGTSVGVEGNGATYGVLANGTVYDFYAAGSGIDYGTASSIRWKKNIVPIGNALEKVMNMRGVYFNWDAAHGGGHDMGMIAEEVGKQVPEIVSYEANGVDATGMDYGKLTPILVNAIKEQQAQIEELKQEVKALRK